MMRGRFAMVVVASACSSRLDPAGPASAVAPLSLAKDAQMVTIPSGDYVAGSTAEERARAYDEFLRTAGHDAARAGRWFETEDERHMARLDAFRLDLLPVTQAEYAERVYAGLAPPPTIDRAAWDAQGGVQDYALVERFAWKDGAPPSGREDHPVVLVTWAEADAYCRWRGALRGEARRLPTAEELEKAARGDQGLAYPWGDAFDADRLNSAVKGPADTTPVGQFVSGASPFGILDVAGNVFQWTSSRYREGRMTVKGSSWDDFAGLGRGAGRHGRPPGTRHALVGFRCAAAPP